MKNGWARATLADVCSITSVLVDPRLARFQDLLHVGAGNMESGTGRLASLQTAAEEGLISGKFLFDEKAVLYSKIRPYLMKVARPDFSGLCSADVYPLEPIQGRIDRDFLFHLLFTPAFTAYAIQGSARAGMPKVNREHLFAYSFPLPLIPEQQRIVAILDEAFDGLATAKANAEKNLQNARAIFESQLEVVFGKPCSGWTEATIGQCINFIDYRGKTPTKTLDGIPLITAKNVKMGFLQEDPMEFMAADAYDAWMTRGIPQMGDVLFTTEAPLANVAQLDTAEKVAFAQRIIIMQPDRSRLDSTFLKYLLLSRPVQQRIHAKGTGATVKGIKASLLRKIEIEFPKAIGEQRRLVETFDSLWAETQCLGSIYRQKLAALDELKQSLLHQAFTGLL